MACALVLGTLATTAALAGDPYGGYGPGDADTQQIGTAADTGAPTPDADQTLPWLRQQSQDQQTTYDGAQQGAAEGDDGTAADDEAGH
jgi:hypothetical protein